MNDTVFIVVPCYNEEQVLFETTKRLSSVLDKLIVENKASPQSKILYVDDGSRDNTWSIISSLTETEKYVCGLKLASNVGHQNALFAGLMTAMNECDCAISIDADLQDTPEAIFEMTEKYQKGCDIVYGVRNGRKTDTFFKRSTALFFYKLMKILGTNVVYNHADFRLLSKRALTALSEFPERNLFLRGMIPLLGFKSDTVYYDRCKRFAGESKYPLKKMLSFAFNGITSFSVSPIHAITAIGFIACIVAAITGIYALVQKFMHNTDAGWTSIICSIWLIGGLQLLGIGLIGEYVGKIYKEVKSRPRYIIDEYKK